MPSLDRITELKARGYAITSRRHRHASRIDRPDWKEHMAAWHVKGFPNQEEAMKKGRAWVEVLGRYAADFYRRCISQDTITVPQSYISWLPNSGSHKAPAEFRDSRQGRASGNGPSTQNLPRNSNALANDP